MLEIAAAHRFWLLSDLAYAVEGMRSWASSTGAWEEKEIAAWDDVSCLAMFVQNIASELRMLGSDDHELFACVATYNLTNWDEEPEYPTGSYFLDDAGFVAVEYYTGE